MWAVVLLSCFSTAVALNTVSHRLFGFPNSNLPPELTKEERELLTVKFGQERNICMKNHFIPELFIIGGIKTSTTTLCTTLRRSPGIQWRVDSRKFYGDPIHPAMWKEGHFFDDFEENGVKFLISSFPKCHKDVRLVATEGAARYSTDLKVPHTISKWYGNLKNHLTFVLLIRDPIDRLHSHFFHSQRDGWCGEFKSMNFVQAVDHILHENHDNYFHGRDGPSGAGCGDFLEGSMWKDQLERWFKHFHPKQFLIVPEKYNVAPGIDGRTGHKVAEFIWEMLGIKGLAQDFAMNRVSANINPKTLQAKNELDLERHSQLFALYAHRWGPVAIARVLAGTDAILYDYNGEGHDVYGIAAWIKKNW